VLNLNKIYPVWKTLFLLGVLCLGLPTSEQNQAWVFTHSPRLLQTSSVVTTYKPQGIRSHKQLPTTRQTPRYNSHNSLLSKKKPLFNPQSLKMQFTTFLSVFVFVATALAAPAPVADSSIEARAGAPSWEFHPFRDVSCESPFPDILGGPQTPGSQCINVTERIGTGVFSAKNTQGCKSKFPSRRTRMR